jgi:hypothetical protein
MTPTRHFGRFCAFFLLLSFSLRFAFAQDEQGGLRILIIEGEGALNNIKDKTLKPVVVEVQNNGAPAPGAVVTFILPNQGPGGTFLNGAGTMTVNADTLGRAASSGIHPNSAAGPMPIRVTASLGGITANATVNQTNVSGVSSSNKGMSKGAKTALILAIIGGGAAAGGIAASHGGSSSSSSTPQIPPIVITPGTPTVGGPH